MNGGCDERGAAPAQTLGAPFTGLFDIKDNAGTADNPQL